MFKDIVSNIKESDNKFLCVYFNFEKNIYYYKYNF